ncbi:hypothetical protein ACLOJK_018655, partial [Asimina triloba]
CCRSKCDYCSYDLLRQSDNLGTLNSSAMAALVGCIDSNRLLVGRNGFLPDLKQTKMAAITDGNGASVNFKRMLSIATSRLARRKKKTPTIAAIFAALLAGFSDRRRWGLWICAIAWTVKEWPAMIEDFF